MRWSVAKTHYNEGRLAVANRVTYVGLDVHDETIVAAWGRPSDPNAMVVANTEEGIEELVRRVGAGPVWAAYETSGVGFVLHDQLTKLGWKVSVLATSRLEKSVRNRKRKTDAEDAKKLLNVLAAHGECGTELPEVWVPPVKIREDRELVRHRLNLGTVVGRIRTKIKSTLKIHGVKYPGKEKTPWTKKYVAWLRGLGGPEGGLARSLQAVIASQLRLLEQAEQEVSEFDRELARLAGEESYQKQVEATTKIKGVGLLTAMTYLVEMGDVKRFRNRGQVGSYLGLTPNSYESGSAEDRKGHISRMGPGRVRRVLNQAAWAYLRCCPAERKWYEQVAYRRGKKRALVGVMRRLGIVIWHRAKAVV